MKYIAFLSLVLLGNTLVAQLDLLDIELKIRPNFQEKSITISCLQHWENPSKQDSVVLKFYPDFSISLLRINDEQCGFRYDQSDSTLILPVASNSEFTLEINYSGKPHEAALAPWDGGFVWDTDSQGQPWLTLACQSSGSMLWWPTPVRYDDEPETSKITCVYPDSLFFKSNGRMVSDSFVGSGLRQTTWETSYAINPYNITLNLGNYSHFQDSLNQLRLDFYPLKPNLTKSKKQFAQAKPMITCFTEAFDSYPFFKDGYSVVETPYAGMEHQSCIAYGNGYENGYNGKDYSGIGLEFDFILIHESAHEWWGNSVSAKYAGDFWLQEAFCTYAEMVYVECIFGKEKALDYIHAKERLVGNKGAILGDTGSGSDMYSKGALMIHTLSGFAENESQWKALLKAFYQEHAYKSISSEELFAWFSARLEGCHPDFFNQYLRFKQPPTIERKTSKIDGKTITTLRLINSLPLAQIPLFLSNASGEQIKVIVSDKPLELPLDKDSWQIDSRMGYFTLIQ
jgi:aminopeptidase N